MSPVAERLLDELATETAQVIEAKLAAARERFANLTKVGVAAQAMIAVLASRDPRTVIDTAEGESCPACGNVGWLICAVEEGDVVADEEEGIPYVETLRNPGAV